VALVKIINSSLECSLTKGSNALKKPLQLKHDKKNQTYIIADMACSHEGKCSLARKIIDGAGQAGADAIQFQIWILNKIMVPHHPDFKRVSSLELSRPQWASLMSYTREKYPYMKIIACVYEQESVDFCETEGVDAYKIHTSDLSNPDLIKYVAKTDKRIDLSVGGSTIDEIKTAVEWIRSAMSYKIWLMYGLQNFPSPTNEVHLRYMLKLKELFELPMGYQDHSDANTEAGFWLCASALGMGIDILENHITHNRSLGGVDHEAALNPDEFAHFVTMVRTIEGALGTSIPRPFNADELKYRKYAKKSLVASRRIATGTRLTPQDLTAMRSDELGLPPDKIGLLIGRAATREIQAYQLLKESDIK